MEFFKIRYLGLFILLLIPALSACSGEGEPKMIAAFPAKEGRTDFDFEVPPPYPGPIVYNADIELEVSDTDKAAQRARRLTMDFDGYLDSATSWTEDRGRHYRLILAVPIIYFDDLREALLGLGKLKRESLWGEKLIYGTDGQHNYSMITLHLIPGKSVWPTLQIRDWNPGETFARASDVFISIFGFVVDILIWLFVVGGPFLLMGWLVWVFFRRRSRKTG